MKKKLILSLTLAATAFVASCNKTDSATVDNASVIPITALELPVNTVTVGKGGSKYLSFNFIPMNATVFMGAFTFPAATGLTVSLYQAGLPIFKVTGTDIAAAQDVVVGLSGATAKAVNPKATLNVIVVDTSTTEPASDFKVSAAGATPAPSLDLTAVRCSSIPLTFSGKNSANADITDFTTGIEEIKPLETPNNSSAVNFVIRNGNNSTFNLSVGARTGKEILVVGAQHNHDVNVKLNLTIVDPVTFTANNSIGNPQFSLAGTGTITLSTLNPATMGAVTGQASGTQLAAVSGNTPGTTLQTISAAGILALLSNTPAFSTLPLGAYSVAVTPVGSSAANGLVATVNNDGSLTLSVGTVLPTTADSYTVTLSSTASANNTISFTVAFVA